MPDTPFEILAQGFQFCEAPRVDESGAVFFSDLIGGGYYRWRAGGTVETVLPDRIWIGGATLDEGGAILCGGKGGLILIEGGRGTPVLTEVDGRAIVAVNDIEADAVGALYGGTLDFGAVFERGEKPEGGLLFRLDPAGNITVLRDDVVASNGIGFSPGGALMYHSESTVGIWAWSMREGIAAGPPALFAAADDCDGLAVDADGGVWVAFWREALIRRYRPDATIDRTIRLPFPHIVSLAFGGPDFTDLYVATGGDADHPGAGGIVRIRSDIPGVAVHRSHFACTLQRE